MKGYKSSIESDTKGNTDFRRVVFTGKYSQLVLMSLKPLEEIGMEVHEKVDQFFRFEEGQGKVIIDGVKYNVKDGDAVIVPAGANHNVINTSETSDLKLYTIYSPPEHKDGTVEHFKASIDDIKELRKVLKEWHDEVFRQDVKGYFKDNKQDLEVSK
jgi:mannose-6-phosphate isomerase-like protein (cupin superfamily)